MPLAIGQVSPRSHRSADAQAGPGGANDLAGTGSRGGASPILPRSGRPTPTTAGRGSRRRPVRRRPRPRVPDLDDPPILLPAELRDRRRPELEAARGDGRGLDPAGGEDAQEVAVGEDEDVAASRQQAPRSPDPPWLRALRGSRRRRSGRSRPSSPGSPGRSRPASAPRRCRSPTPGGHRRARPGRRSPANRAVSAARASGLDTTRVNVRPARSARQPLGLRDARGVERDVRPAGVPAGLRPVRLAVANDDETRRRRGLVGPGHGAGGPSSASVRPGGGTSAPGSASKNGRGRQPNIPASRTAGTWAIREFSR